VTSVPSFAFTLLLAVFSKKPISLAYIAAPFVKPPLLVSPAQIFSSQEVCISVSPNRSSRYVYLLKLGELVGWAAREERERSCFWGLHASFVLSSAPLHLFSWHFWFCEALSASSFLFLTEASYTHILRHINSFFLVLLDAFSSRFFKTNILFLFTLFSSTYICFMFPLASVPFARCSFRLFPNFR